MENDLSSMTKDQLLDLLQKVKSDLSYRIADETRRHNERIYEIDNKAACEINAISIEVAKFADIPPSD